MARKSDYGALAQLGERNTGSVEVSGSIPLGSTKKISNNINDLWSYSNHPSGGFFMHKRKVGKKRGTLEGFYCSSDSYPCMYFSGGNYLENCVIDFDEWLQIMGLPLCSKLNHYKPFVCIGLHAMFHTKIKAESRHGHTRLSNIDASTFEGIG